MLVTTAKEWGTPLYLVAGSGVDMSGCGLLGPADTEIAVKHT
jgi:hypothetical protein